jgi:biotin carboxyl carrier protein
MLVADEQAAVTRSHEVVIEDDRTGTLGVWMDGALVSVRLRDRRRSRRQAVDDVGGQAAQALRAPMPGRIVKVLVAAGQRVAVRQPLVVIEAMKMENELRSTVAGVISEVRVAAGSAVEAEALLVVVTPENGTGA